MEIVILKIIMIITLMVHSILGVIHHQQHSFTMAAFSGDAINDCLITVVKSITSNLRRLKTLHWAGLGTCELEMTTPMTARKYIHEYIQYI